MKKYSYPIPIYFGKFNVLIGEDLTKHFREVDKPFNDITDCYIQNDVLRIDVGIKSSASPEMIAHECVHAANMIFEHVGAKIDLDNDEPYAYLVGWLVKQVHNSLDKYNRK